MYVFSQLILPQWVSLDVNIMEKIFDCYDFLLCFFFLSVYKLLMTFRKAFPEL